MSAAPGVARPKAWKYLLVAALLLLILIPAWTLVVMLLIQPPSLMQEPPVSKQVMWWVVMPLLAVFGVVGWRWQVANEQVAAIAMNVNTASVAATAASEQARREYVLEVISLGVTLDKFRQGALWDQLKEGHAYASIRERDPNKYAWSADEKEGLEGLRSGHTLENGANFTPMYWGAPTFAADSAAGDPANPVSPDNPTLGLAAGATSSGMAFNLFVAAGWELSERPDRLLERVFSFFDQNPDVPYVVLSGADGLYFRNMYRPKGTPALIHDGYYIPEMPDSSALFVLARRERVDAIRPFAFSDVDHIKLSADELNARGYARRLGLAYVELQMKLAKAHGGMFMPSVNVPEWLATTRAFTLREDIYPKGFSALAGDLNPLADNHPPRDFRPTPWFPLPWNKDQLSVFDRLPTLGYLHRPVFVKTVDGEGQPLARRDARAAALAAGWQQALQTLPEAERKAAPARVITATGGDTPRATDQTIALHSMLNAWAEQGGPELDSAKPGQWINTDARLGNTGAATWFMQMAIGVMGSYRDGGVSAAINLRDPSEASIVLISPPSDDQRKHQHHPEGGDVFRHHATPAIDPANYQQDPSCCVNNY